MLPNNPNEELMKAIAFQRLSPYMMQEKNSRMNGSKIAPDVFFYSDYLNHKSYNKCVAMLRENNIPFGYLHGVNPDITIKQIYDSLEI